MKENNIEENINHKDFDNENEVLLLKEPLLSNKLNNKNFDKNGNSRFNINYYDIYCDSRFRIKEIITLKYTKSKQFLFIILNVFTLGVINLIIKYFPHLKLYLLYNEIDINKSSYVGIFCEDGFFFIEKLIKNLLPNIDKIPLKKYIVSNIPNTNKIYSFKFKDFKYIYNEEKKCFDNICFIIKATENEVIQNFWNGLTSNEVDYQNLIYGKNEINIKIDNFIILFFNEFKNLFNIYIVLSVILWCINDYIIYAIIVSILFLYYLIDNIFEKKRNLENLKNFSNISNDTTVFVNRRNNEDNNERVLKNINDLVPGEIYELPDYDNFIIPCDSIILSGKAIVDESIISGKSYPVYKTSLLPTNNIFDIKKCQHSILYSGTKLIHTNFPKNNKTKVIVIGTSFMTLKGNIIRSILYPDEKLYSNKFSINKKNYIVILFLLSIFSSLISYKIQFNPKKNIVEKIIISLDIITILLPPILPICLNIGLNQSVKRLKKKNINCLNKEKVNISGTINTIILESNEILNEDKVDIEGIQPVIFSEDEKLEFDKVYNNLDDNIFRGFNNFQNKINNIENIVNNNHMSNEEYNQLFIECLACCNQISCDNDGKLIGNLLDLKMLEISKWKIKKYNGGIIQLYLRPPQENELKIKINSLLSDEDENLILKSHYEIGIVKIFKNFEKGLKMSCLVKDLNHKNYKLFVKGAPEIIKELCRNNSLPDNYEIVLNDYTKSGYQVISLAYSYKNINFKNIENIDVNQLEKNLIFLGFVIIRNEIKYNIPLTIEKLKKENYKIFLSTSKNILSTINISKQSHIINTQDILFSIELDENNNIKFKHIENYSDSEKFEMIEKFYEIESDLKTRVLDKDYFNEKFEFSYQESSNIIDTESESELNNKNKDYSLNLDLNDNSFESLYTSINKHIMVINGSTFGKIFLLRNKYLSTKDKKFLQYLNAFNLIINKCRIFSGMNSWNKMILIQSLKERGNIIYLCSNNNNDFGALNISDIGLNFNEKNIGSTFSISEENYTHSSILSILLEGKASLVSSIQIFKIIILYGFIQFTAVIILLLRCDFFSNLQFLASDLFIIIPLCYLVSNSESNNKLSYHKLTGDICNFSMYLSLLLQIIISLFFQILSIFILNRNNEIKNYKAFPTYSNNVLFLISNLQYLIIAISLNISYPFKKNIFRNYLLILFLLIGFSFYAYVIVDPDYYSLHYLNLNYFPSYSFRIILLIIGLLNLVFSYLSESYLVPYISFYYYNNYNAKEKEYI